MQLDVLCASSKPIGPVFHHRPSSSRARYSFGFDGNRSIMATNISRSPTVACMGKRAASTTPMPRTPHVMVSERVLQLPTHQPERMLPSARRVGLIMTRFIDIGANLTDPVFVGNYRGKQKHKDDMDTVLQRAKATGVDKIMITGGTLSESKEALRLARSKAKDDAAFPALFSTVGVHPTRCGEFEHNEEGLSPEAYFSELEALCAEGAKDGTVVAIGECGLDYDRLEFCTKELQLKYFEKQFELAEKTKLPMFLHNRNTEGDFYAMISKNRHRFSNGVVHSFTGCTEEAQKLVELGLYIGINGCSLKTAENLETMKSIPTDRLMIETDAPWCDIRATHAGFSHVKTTWPTKKAEKHDEASMVKSRNEPCTIRQVLEVISGVRGEDPIQLAEHVYENTRRVFFPSA